MPAGGSARRLSPWPSTGSCSMPWRGDWIVRFDRQRKAYRLPLADIERLATLTPDGELAVPFHYFVRCDYPDWPYAERAVLIEP
jgi:hypothetical protein